MLKNWGYRIPYKMFFDWFVPFSQRGSLIAGVVFPPVASVFFLAILTGLSHLFSAIGLKGPGLTFGVPYLIMLWTGPTLIPMFAVFLSGYHHHVKLESSIQVGCGASALWLMLLAFFNPPFYMRAGIALFLLSFIAHAGFAVAGSYLAFRIQRFPPEPAV